MISKEEAFLAALRSTFRVEAAEHLQTITAGLLALERAPAGEREGGHTLDDVFRAAHSLKGAARAVEWGAIEAHCEALEDIFAGWKRAGAVPPASDFDGLYRTLDDVGAALARAADAPLRKPPGGAAGWLGASVVAPVLRQAQAEATSAQLAPAHSAAAPEGVSVRPASGAPGIASVAPPGAPSGAPAPVAADDDAAAVVAPSAAAAAAGDSAVARTVLGTTAPPARIPPVGGSAAADATVRISIAKLDARLVHAEEMLAIKLRAGQRAADLRGLSLRLAACNAAWSALRADGRALSQPDGTLPAGGAAAAAERLLFGIDRQSAQLASLEAEAVALARSAARDHHDDGQAVDDLLAGSRQLLRLPWATQTPALQKVVRDLCRDQGKEADLRLEGESLELDRRILEGIKDPLIHLLRNAVDHGVETPAARLQAGKPARAVLTVALTQREDNQLELLVADDGAGIDARRVRAAAVARARLSAEAAAALADDDAIALIFESELSTRAVAGSVSGRGLGLAIVREQIAKLGGSVGVESPPGVGTRFRIVVPSMLATFRGLLVEVAGQLFVLPTLHVACVVRVAADEIRMVEGRETLSIGGRAVAHVRLADVLRLPLRPPVPAEAGAAPRTPVVVLGSGEQRIAFAIDALHDEQEMLVKPLVRPLARVRHVSAATVLGNGEVAPILHVGDLMKSARHGGAARLRPPVAAAPAVARRVLVAEDSITSRMLIRSILEAAGYHVETAVDGLDAFTLLRAGDFDLVVSDVEMPRLDGFGLTARIRADARLAELPVILLSALETREHRERGIDVGASAYLVKSGFDQGSLLEAVRRLV